MNNNNEKQLYPWTVSDLLEIDLDEPECFLKIKETLSRMGVASSREDILFQSCHILHKRGRYYCAHFKELFKMDGRSADITIEDIRRRNTIASLLEQWGLCKIVMVDRTSFNAQLASVNTIKIVAHKDKGNWVLQTKYQMRSDRVSR